jgi:5'(3')-deoxyribonucleotidase
MNNFKFKVFTDCDGVLADFNGGFIKKFGKPFESFNTNWCWEQINSDPHHFLNLEVHEGAREYWDVIAPFNPTVLTGCPRAPGYDDAARSKIAWVAKHFGEHVPVIACMSKDKHLHMVQPGDILIDDHERNLKGWRKAGGTGILFINAEQAIDEFKRAVAALSTL